MSAIIAYFPQLMQGLIVTLQISIGGFFLGFLIAIFITFIWNISPAPIRFLIASYIAFIRGIPEVLVICLFFFGGTQLLNKFSTSYIEINGLVAGICALGAVSSAYFVEILRGALISIPAGQKEAATSLGLSRMTTFFQIIMPQIFMLAWPAIGNQWLIILKDSALISIVSYEDLMRKATVGGGSSGLLTEFYIVAALIYIAVTVLSTLLFQSINKYMVQGR
ncbi:ABC transporter permease subunit [Bartonella sp. HY329]|uniref:amino acid ABC transporter permease n=1 Tax=unclassified Bartonella TaxID=2645622 RepID=UPI0021CA7DCF|nr:MULTISPECIES: ABC transporter permease subunit [unclassified Bartonella]UXM95840.1 ABC transporter permease subunit [Bartonella sp. HY329]UXN10165.1 ABC transporter permease subunit [Bartonella sp. HY328]